MSFAAGSIVRVREREWVVLPQSSEEILHLRPLGGSPAEQTAIHTALEEVRQARFDRPGGNDVGDIRSAQLLRDAAVLGSPNSAAAIRCFSRINVEPRSYQLVPLLMALRKPDEAVRLLIADGVGIGKTIESLLIARELWDRGEIGRIAVLCPPALADQWHREIRTKFQLDAALVLASTARKLESRIVGGGTLFEHYPVTVVSLDYIKSERRRQEFLRTAPDFVIVDEAHTCAGDTGRGQSHLRHEVVRGLAQDEDRHMLFVTATPHSGNQDAFDTLIGMLSPQLRRAQGKVSQETVRSRLAQHFIQRRRLDVQHFIDEDTRFPKRLDSEHSYKLTAEYRKLFDACLSYARRSVRDSEEGSRDRRVRWWSALALLRALGSSPAAAAATLRNRAASAQATSAEEADAIGRSFVMDRESVEDAEVIDTVAGSLPGGPEGPEEDNGDTEGAQEKEHPGGAAGESPDHRKLLELARQAERIGEMQDAKLRDATTMAQGLLTDGYNPIFFCRYLATAEYLGRHFRERLAKASRKQHGEPQVIVVTGELPPAEREARIASLAAEQPRVLVATDCLSEGINLQDYFDAVVHYDLSWNPTRHEQREGRVDRYGQPRPDVRTVTYYGSDNPVDGLVLDVLIHKHKAIRSELGISIPVPADTTDVLDALLEGLILRSEWKGGDDGQLLLEGLEEEITPHRRELHAQWDRARDREEEKVHSRYAHTGIDAGKVAHHLAEVRRSAGDRHSVRRLVENTVRLHGGRVTAADAERLQLSLQGLPRQLQSILNHDGAAPEAPRAFSFDGPQPGHRELHRSHRRIRELAAFISDSALDGTGSARRAGVTRTDAVSVRTALALLRIRFRLRQRNRGGQWKEELVESTLVRAFRRGSDGSLTWLSEEDSLALFSATPSGNVSPDMAGRSIDTLVAFYQEHEGDVEALVQEETDRLLESHQAIRAAVSRSRATVELTPQRPVDLLGLYVFLPTPQEGAL
ncbi:MAG: helicase-related protein [bacterium]